jgi:hypothetical protein
MFAYVRLKSLMFAYFEKKYFFPALWLLRTGTQYVVVIGLDAARKLCFNIGGDCRLFAAQD